ncbi:MAG: leucyl aminopeptidase family protein [Bacteroidales bacterium]
MTIHLTDRIKADESFVVLISSADLLPQSPLSLPEQEYIASLAGESKRDLFFFNRLQQQVWVYLCGPANDASALEKLRRKGDELVAALLAEKTGKAVIMPVGADNNQILALAEGMALGAYRFERHKKKEENRVLFSKIKIASGALEQHQVSELENLVKACFAARDMVNEPGNLLDAMGFARKMESFGSRAGLHVEVLGRKQIEALKMEGLLTVNKGSKSDPTFTIMEWKPENPRNKQPVVLVGKGLVFDTGGINLKPTPGLEAMKSDMAGGAAVFGALYAAALNQLPLHVIAMVPATDNRPGEQAMLPGDIIRMGNGKTVEILNTDAEGRLILADALLHAARYNPALVIDIATLTGSAAMAIGKYGVVAMHQQADDFFVQLKEAGMLAWERLAELPFWEEYGEEMVSDIADLRNIGKGKGAGAITAGKFLAHFTSYPWIHLDIAGMAFMDGRESYLGKGGTGVGVRLLYRFLAAQC